MPRRRPVRRMCRLLALAAADVVVRGRFRSQRQAAVPLEGRGCLALYERGNLWRVYPISAGTSGAQTPLFDFKITGKDKDHYSSIFETWMPWALHLKGAYYIHGGVLPGQADSAGCIRLPIDDAEQLFNAVEVGTLGRIIATPKVEQDIYPAPFCR